MSPATGIPRSSSWSATGDEPRALARRALGLAVRSSPSWSGEVSEVVELSRRHPHEFDDDVIHTAIGLVTTFTRPGPMTDEAIELLVGLQTPRRPRRVPEVEQPNTAPTVRGVEPPHHERSVISIVMIEGRGIWIELTGALVERRCDVVAERLAQLGGLDFAVAVVDVRRVTAVDVVGRGAVVQFAEPIVEAGGTVRIVDPDGRLRRHGDAWQSGVAYTAEPPTGDWWR